MSGILWTGPGREPSPIRERREPSPARERREPRVVRLATELVDLCHALQPVLAQRTPALGDQAQRAAASVLANGAEGLDADTPREKRRFFGYAMRSASECERLLGALRRLDAAPALQLERARAVLFAIRMDLHRLMRWAASRSA